MSEPGDLPTGIVTFVFTDIEGSTRLLRRFGDGYADLLDRHLSLMAEAWDAHDGHPIGTAGDSVFVAFQDATAAVVACAEAQRKLCAEPWPPDGEVRVRIGLHTGLAAPHAGEYRALAVHQAARVMSAAHGGQVLVSAATTARLSRLDDIALQPLGRFRVRDFEEPLQLFELAGPGLPAEFPAVRALPADGHNLVPPPTSFHGREAEAAEVAAALGPGELVTLTGPGGVGKTRLATEIGLRVADAWPDGAWFVDLAPIDNPALIPSVVGQAVGAPSRGGDRWVEVLEHMSSHQALLIVDNCELLADDAGLAVDELLSACPACGVLATSRVPLAVRREQVWRLGPLDLAGRADGDPAVVGPAVALFLDRVAAVRRDLTVDESSMRTVVEICEKLDGLPLALELAAARLAVLSPEEVLSGLSDRFQLLRSHNPAAPERQRTMEALLEWSDRLLDDGERACLRRLSVFGASFSIDAAAAAAAADDVTAYDVPELVWSLVDKSLVVADLTANSTRYRLLESVRDFARRRLDEHGETDASAVRLAQWYVEFIGPARRQRAEWASDVGVEIDNLRALVSLVAGPAPGLAQELAYTVARHLDAVDAFGEGLAQLERHLALLDAHTPASVALLTTLADLRSRTGDAPAARQSLVAAEARLLEVGSLPAWDDVAIERTRADIACRSGDYQGAVDAATRALAGELSEAGRARMCSQLGVAAFFLGDDVTATWAFEEELQVHRRYGDRVYEASALGNLAEVALRRGDRAAAAHHQRGCLTLALELGAPVMAAFSLIVAARLVAADGQWELATKLHSHAESVLDATGLVLYEGDKRSSDEMLDAARENLGPAAFGAARAAGHALELTAAAALADRVLATAAEG